MIMVIGNLLGILVAVEQAPIVDPSQGLVMLYRWPLLCRRDGVTGIFEKNLPKK